MKPASGEDTIAAVDFDVANRLFFRLYQASNLLHREGTRYVQAFGATTQQWAVLGALSRDRVSEAGMTVKDLIDFLDVSRQNLGALLDRLEDRAWIERVVDSADGRSRRIRMTGKGKEIWRGLRSPIEAFYTAALTPFSVEERATLLQLLDRLKDSLTQV